MKITEVIFTELSKADYDALSPDLKAECTAILRKLKQAGKKLGIPLENKNISGICRIHRRRKCMDYTRL